MQALADLYQKHRGTLQAQLTAAKTLQNAVDLVRDTLRAMQSAYDSASLTRQQQRMIWSMFDLLDLSLKSVGQAVDVPITTPLTQDTATDDGGFSNTPSDNQSDQPRDVLESVTEGFDKFVHLAGRSARLALAQGEKALRVLSSTSPSQSGENSASSYENLQTELPSQQFSSVALINWLDNALPLADQLLTSSMRPATIESPPPVTEPELHSDVIEWLQQFVGNVHEQDAKAIFKSARRLDQVLEEYGLQFLSYEQDHTAATGLNIHQLYDFDPGTDPALNEPLTLLPACVKAGRVVLRGRVMLQYGANQP